MAVNRYYSNNAVDTTLASNASSGATTIVVSATTGFPLSYPYTLVLDPGEATQELVEVSSASGTTLTVTRGVDGTSAQSHTAGAVVRHDVSARDYREPQEHIAATNTVHGVAGSVVGTSDTQTLTNKTIDGASNTVTNVPKASVTGAPTGAFVGTTDTQTLTNKTVALGSNTVSGTTAQFNASNTDGDFATLAGTETLTNKTLTSPAVNTPAVTGGTVTGAAIDGTTTIDGVAASALVAEEPGAWTPITINTGLGYSAAVGAYTPAVRVRGTTVEFCGSINGTLTAGNDNIVGQIPAGFRPNKSVRMAAISSSGFPIKIEIDSSSDNILANPTGVGSSVTTCNFDGCSYRLS